MNKTKKKRVAARNRVTARKQPVGVLPSTCKKVLSVLLVL